MERKLEKFERVIPKMPMIEWLFYPTVLIIAMTLTIISTFITFIGTAAWLFVSMVLFIHAILLKIQNDRMLLTYTYKINAICFTIGLIVYGLILSLK